MWDLVIVKFSDGTSTSLWVGEDEDIQDAVVDLCERSGWDASTVTGWHIERTVTDPEG